MVTLQCLNKIIATGDISIITKNGFDESYFAPYQQEAKYIIDHYNQYHVVPDAQTLISVFPEFQFFEVKESDSYLINAITEEKAYSDMAPVLQKAAEIMRTDANDAIDYLKGQLDKKSTLKTEPVDIIKMASDRYEKYKKKHDGDERDFFITTGFQELDDAIHGFQRGEEYVIFFARTNQGKSWILTKSLTHAWQIGHNVGMVSPEMSEDSIGYRFDTLYGHFNNQDLNFGADVDGYEEYIEQLKSRKNKFVVSTPSDFGNIITVSKLRSFVTANNLDILGIDGISYLRDERAGKYDKREAELTHISEDLITMSRELGIPILCVVQANRDGVKINQGELELENIRDADGIAFNATKVLSIRQKFDEETIQLAVKKNRNGKVGSKFIYHWVPEIGEFTFIPSNDNNTAYTDSIIEETKKSLESEKGKCVF